ncbi:MAG TPA: stage II sporulation protein M, partial [Isosphaeraceae bacterium]
GAEFLEQIEQMYAEPIGPGRQRDDALMAGFYIQHNASIGLQCYAWGLAFGLGTLSILFDNAKALGTAFGSMARTPYAGHFYTFVTAHAPFELTAIVFSGGAGLRLGWGLIDTQGQTRLASLRREAARSLPTVGAAVFLFVLAAFLEGFVSGSALPYPYKAAIALACSALLVAYLALGGRAVGRSGSRP